MKVWGATEITEVTAGAAVPIRLELTLEGDFRGYALGPEFRGAAEELLSRAGIELSGHADLNDPDGDPTPDSIALYRSSGRWTLSYASLVADPTDLPAVYELYGRELRLGGSGLRVVAVHGRVVDRDALAPAARVRIRFATPAVLGGSPAHLPPLRSALESAAEIWRRWLGVELRVPSKVRVVRARLRVARGRWGSGLVGWAELEQEDGETLGALAQAAEFSGVGAWRGLGFGAVEVELL